MWIQFFLPIAMPRMEFSARLLLSSTSGYRRNASSLGQSPSAYPIALPSLLAGNACRRAASIFS